MATESKKQPKLFEDDTRSLTNQGMFKDFHRDYQNFLNSEQYRNAPDIPYMTKMEQAFKQAWYEAHPDYHKSALKILEEVHKKRAAAQKDKGPNQPVDMITDSDPLRSISRNDAEYLKRKKDQGVVDPDLPVEGSPKTHYDGVKPKPITKGKIKRTKAQHERLKQVAAKKAKK